MSEELLVFIDKSHSGNKNPWQAHYLWENVYASGKYKEDFDYDIVLFNQPKPNQECYLLSKTENNKTVVINLVSDKGVLKGRCCYIDDYESLKMVNEPETWR